MTLDELIANLRQHESVDAVAIIGSTSEGRLNPASDYDLLIVLNDPPLDLVGGVTYLDERFTDLLFTTPQEINQLNDAGQNEISIDGIPGTIIRWIQTVQIEFDKCDCLLRLQKKVRNGFSLRLFSEGEMLSRLDKASYNLAHTQRMLTSDDEVFHLAIDLRLLYQLADLMVDYFHVRGLPWQGEKAAIRYWQSQYRDYFDLFMKCLNESDRVTKVGLYRELATATMAPIGSLWATGTTTFRLSPDADMTRENISDAEKFWQAISGANE